MKLLVCGGRDYSDKERVYHILDELDKEFNITCIIHGAARGADSLASTWAHERGKNQREFPADWVKYGKYAGPIRNQEMILEGNPDAAVAFPGGNGTRHMVKLLNKHQIQHVIIDGETWYVNSIVE